MKLIVNADDLGLCCGVNLGIMEAYNNGVVRSATIMPTGAGFSHAVQLAKQHPGLGVGVHLTLTSGRPVCQGHITLVDSHGNFSTREDLKAAGWAVDIREVHQEFTAQIQKVIEAGLVPTHLDSHHHIHLLPTIFPVVLSLAKEMKLPLRVRQRSQIPAEYAMIDTPDRLVDRLFKKEISLEQLNNLLLQADPKEVLEVMVHPGYVDRYLLQNSSYSLARAEELAVLTDPVLISQLPQMQVELINYRYFHQ